MPADLTYKQLLAKTAHMEKRIARNAGAIQAAAHIIETEAEETRRECDQMGAKSVDRETLADSQELSRVIRGLSVGILTYAAKGIDTARQAHAVGDQARSSHGGIQEAFDRSRIDGLDQLDRDWLEQQ